MFSMCLRPVKIRNKSLTVGCSDYQKFNLEVPCGQCAECKTLMRDQWYLRAYWQCRYVFDNGGFVLFDTLTYDDHSLPMLSDFVPEFKNRVMDHPCFSQAHVRRFFIDLRQFLSRAGYRTDFGYFLCSEYGSHTHRPHYHILLFSTDPNLDPETLSQMVSKAWKHGRTDGLPWQTRTYVMNRNVFGPRYNSDTSHAQAVCRYVMKYITKDNDYQGRVKYRLDQMFQAMCQEKYRGESNIDFRDTEFADAYKVALRNVNQFHRQSQHFGEYALTKADMEEIFSDGTMAVPDKDVLVKHIPLPMYYSRKLFCTQVKLDDGRRVWVPTELGKRYRYKRNYQAATHMVRKYNDWLANMDTAYLSSDEFSLPDGSRFHLSDEECRMASKELQNEFYRLMAGRSLMDLAVYAVFYRGRVIPRDELLDPVFRHPRDIVSMSLSSDPRHTQNVWKRRTYVDDVTGEEVDMMSVLSDECFEAEAGRRYSGASMSPDLVTLKVFARYYTINDSYFEQFKDFDRVLELIDDNMKIRGRRRQQVFDVKEYVEKVRKNLRNI